MATVLLATDGSGIAAAAMVRAVGLLGRDHRFVAVTVVPPPFAPAVGMTPMDTHPVVDPTLEAERTQEDIEESSGELADLVSQLDVPAETMVEQGEPGPAVCRVAEDVGADLVVVGSHGHGWLQRVLVGSVSHHVVEHAPCPVLVMRHPASAG